MDIKLVPWILDVIKVIPSPSRILEVGSRNVNGGIREHFPSYKEYIGIDMIEGKDVDIVMNNHDILNKFEKDSFDVVVDFNCLEHDNKFWITLNNIDRVLKRGGFHMLAVPTFNFPIHRYPKDYWRMGEDAVIEVILENYEVSHYAEIFTAEVDGKPVNPIICALGKKL